MRNTAAALKPFLFNSSIYSLGFFGKLFICTRRPSMTRWSDVTELSRMEVEETNRRLTVLTFLIRTTSVLIDSDSR